MSCFSFMLLTGLVSDPPAPGSATRPEHAPLPCISLLSLVEHPEVARRMNLTTDQKVSLVLVRDVARDAVGRRPQTTPERQAWIAKYIREESDGKIAEALAQVLTQAEGKKLRELRKEYFRTFSPELMEELKLSEQQLGTFFEAIASVDEEIAATTLRRDAKFETWLVGVVAQRQFHATQKLAESLDVEQQWKLAGFQRLPLRKARDVKSLFLSEYYSIAKLLLVGKLRAYLAFSSGTSQRIDREIEAWRDEQEKLYVEAERDWTPFKEGRLRERLLKCDKALKSRLESVLTKEERHRLAQITLQLQGVGYAFTGEGAKKLGVTNEQMRSFDESFMRQMGRSTDDLTAEIVARVKHPKPWEIDSAWEHLTDSQKERWLKLIGKPIPIELRSACSSPFTALGMKW